MSTDNLLDPTDKLGDSFYPVEVTDPYSEGHKISHLRKWNHIWKCTSGACFIFATLSLFLTTMVVSYSHNPTFVNDFILATYMGNWYSPMTADPLGHHANLIFSNTVTVQKLNQGKPVLPIHSHNDYWRKFPFFEALSRGCQSVEADVWYLQGKPDELFVGHHKRSLSSLNTLYNMYLDPLESLLDAQNAHNVLTDGESLGVFDSDPKATLYFVLDIKNEPEKVFDLISRSFERLERKGYLTTFNTSTKTWTYGPVTLIISGDVPVEQIAEQEVRTMFIDAPIMKILESDSHEFDIETGMSIFSSASLLKMTGSHALRVNGGLTQKEHDIVTVAISKMHERGLKVRIWETPEWPATQRDVVWRELIDMGVDLINANDLRAAAHL